MFDISAVIAAMPPEKLAWLGEGIEAILALTEMGLDQNRVTEYFQQSRHTIVLALSTGAKGKALARAIAADLAAVLPGETPAEGGHHDE